jgi:hypothetical protein
LFVVVLLAHDRRRIRHVVPTHLHWTKIRRFPAR